MEARDFRNLTEAYYQVYEQQLDEAPFQTAASNIRKFRREEVDLILSHLLDEGYANTPESAEAIMENMSEGWRDSILEKFISPYEVKPSNLQGHSPATKAMQKSDDLQRTEPGSERQRKQTIRSQQLNRMFQAARQA